MTDRLVKMLIQMWVDVITNWGACRTWTGFVILVVAITVFAIGIVGFILAIKWITGIPVVAQIVLYPLLWWAGNAYLRANAGD